MTGFTRDVPGELEEAAWMDGCGTVRASCAVVLPLRKPRIVGVGSLTIVPVVVLFASVRQFLAQGLSAGAAKGDDATSPTEHVAAQQVGLVRSVRTG